MDEMARQLTAEIENALGVEGLADSSVELVMAFANNTYLEHISENVTYRRLMLVDKVSAPRDFWVKWTRLAGEITEYSADNIRFELGEDVEQKIREKEYRYLIAEGKDGYHNSMGRKKVTEWREVVKRAAKRGELTKIEDDLELSPEIFEIEINGKRIDKTDCGYFRDAAFRLLDIASAVEVGANTIRFRATITQSPETYQHLENSWTFEGMKNCLSYDMEVEPIYLVGDFGVAFTDTPEELKLDAYRTHSPLVITAGQRVVDIAALDMSGYPEFAGTITLEKTFNLDNTNYYVSLKGRGINSIRLAVNGKHVATVMNPPYEVDLSDYLVKGENTVTLTLLNNLRNMMGPHHWLGGELLAVAPSSFYLESNVFFHFDGANESNHEKILKYWNDGVCLVHYGLKVD